jgi:hypothetical protein
MASCKAAALAACVEAGGEQKRPIQEEAALDAQPGNGASREMCEAAGAVAAARPLMCCLLPASLYFGQSTRMSRDSVTS